MAGSMLIEGAAVSHEAGPGTRSNDGILDKIHTDDTGDGSVVPSISNIAPVVGKPSSNIMIHTPTNSENPHTLPSAEVVV